MAKDSRGGKRNAGTQSVESFIKDIVDNYNEFTRGDLQGVVEAYAEQTGRDDEELLREIDRRANNKTMSIANITQALNNGETIIIDRQGDIEGARFRIRNGKVQVSSSVLDLYRRGEWYDHPTFNKQTLVTHLRNLKKEGRTIHT